MVARARVRRICGLIAGPSGAAKTALLALAAGRLHRRRPSAPTARRRRLLLVACARRCFHPADRAGWSGERAQAALALELALRRRRRAVRRS